MTGNILLHANVVRIVKAIDIRRFFGVGSLRFRKGYNVPVLIPHADWSSKFDAGTAHSPGSKNMTSVKLYVPSVG